MKTCTHCRKSFEPTAAAKRLKQSWCPKCRGEGKKTWYHANRDSTLKKNHAYNASPKGREVQFISQLKRVGVTLEQYHEMFAQQGGLCAICECRPYANKRLAIDHDHSCCPGRKGCERCFRGLLCTRCNVSLERLESNNRWMKKAAKYLKEKSANGSNHISKETNESGEVLRDRRFEPTQCDKHITNFEQTGASSLGGEDGTRDGFEGGRRLLPRHTENPTNESGWLDAYSYEQAWEGESLREGISKGERDWDAGSRVD